MGRIAWLLGFMSYGASLNTWTPTPLSMPLRRQVISTIIDAYTRKRRLLMYSEEIYVCVECGNSYCMDEVIEDDSGIGD